MSLKTLREKAMGGNGPEPFERPYERLWCHRLEETMGDIRMYERHRYRQPEKTATTGLPIGVMLLALAAIAVYLIVGGEILDDHNGAIAVYLPQVEAK